MLLTSRMYHRRCLAPQAPFNPWPVPQTATVQAKLPKLEVRKFGGNISEWREFWDSFESAIDRNETLAEIDKFSYLRGLLIEPARSAIAGFSLTSANYKAAIQLLKKRDGKQKVIQRAYINDLLNLEPIYGERDKQRLRTMYDEWTITNGTRSSCWTSWATRSSCERNTTEARDTRGALVKNQ